MKYRSETLNQHTQGRWNYFIDLGGRFTGKSYAWKSKAIKDFLLKGEKVLYIRRMEKDINATKVQNYWADIPVYDLTNGEYSVVVAYGSKLYLGNINDKGKLTKELLFGYYYSLVDATSLKSTLRGLGIGIALYEEFIPEDGRYLHNEVDILQGLMATIFGRENVRCVLIGNTLSRVNPYYISWNLKGVRKQKVNTIEDYFYNEAGDQIKNIDKASTIVRVAYVQPKVGKLSGYIGGKGKQISNGIYETEVFPRPYKNYQKVGYPIGLVTQGFSFILEMHKCKEGRYIFIRPMKKIPKRIITDEFSINPKHTPILLVDHYEFEKEVQRLLNFGKTTFSDNLTATDFYHCLINYKGLTAYKPIYNERIEEEI